MTEEEKPKKRKIDLKARLSSVRSSTGSAPPPAGEPGSDPAAFPPPPTSGSVPPPTSLASGAGIAPPPGFTPFGDQPKEKESKPSAQAQTIKVEVGEEVIAERKKARTKTILFVVLALVVGAVPCFFLGITKQKRDVENEGIAGAAKLSQDVEAANTVLAGLSDDLRKAGEDLGNQKFPTKLADKLKATHVPFGGDQLEGKNIGVYPALTLKLLLAYSSGVEELNNTKDRLKSMLDRAKVPFDRYVKEKKDPVIHFSVVFSQKKKGAVAELVPNLKPFVESKDWPKKYKIKRLVGAKPKEVEVILWDMKEKLVGTQKVIAVPVAHKTVAGLTTEKDLLQLRKVLLDTKQIIDGRESRIPSQVKEGLHSKGEKLIEELRKLARIGK